MNKLLRVIAIVFAIAFSCLPVIPVKAQSSGAIVADHRAVEQFDQIPEYWINQAKQKFVIGYGHTSHGSQITNGMRIVQDEFGNLYDYDRYGAGDALYYYEGASYGDGDLDHDVGYYPNWVTETRTFLENSQNNHFNIIMWSWCGQASSRTQQSMIDTYLQPMTDFEEQYPGVTFIYMTGHLDGTGINGNLRHRNDQIRDYVRANNKVLFDFADIERHDLNGADHPSETDACNWCLSWCNQYPQDCPSCSSCAHSHCLNCFNKGKAFWWMMARLAGWDGQISPPPLTGDLNNDGRVDIFDLVIVGTSFGRSPGQSGYDSRADANNSGGAIDIFDLILVGSHFGEGG